MDIIFAFVLLSLLKYSRCFLVGSKQTVTLYHSYNYYEVYSYLSQPSYVILQVHSQHENNTISLTPYPMYGQEYESFHSGIVKSFDNYHGVYFYAKNSGYEYSLNALLLAVPIKNQHPIPGGCCLTCALENDPNLQISYDDLKTTVSFSRASKYYQKSSQPDCDGTENPKTLELAYHIYYMYINENDYSEESLFDSLFDMSTPDKIKSNGILLTELSGTQSLSLDIETILAQGVVFNVIVSDLRTGHQTAYVPASVYACNFTASEGSKENCYKKDSTIVLIFTIIFAAVGLLVCFAGFKLFRLFIFVTSTLLYWFIIFVVLSRYTDSEKITQESNFIIAFMISLIGGGITLLMYACEKLFYLVFVKTCLVFGMFLSAIIFYTPFGYFEVWNEDYRFILGFVSIALVFAMASLFAPKASVYFCSSLLGSYAIIMVPNYFLRSNMQYILMTVVNRLVIPKFGNLYLRRPFERTEKILTGCWAGVLLLGIIIQYATTKDQEFYYSGKRLRHRVWGKLSQSVNLGRQKRRNNLRRPVPARQYQESPPPDETAPLLNNLETSEDHTTGNYGGIGQTNRSVESTPQIHQSPTAPPVVEHQPLLHQSPRPIDQNVGTPTPPPPYEEHDQDVPRHAFQPPAYEANERQPLLQAAGYSNDRYPTRIV